MYLTRCTHIYIHMSIYLCIYVSICTHQHTSTSICVCIPLVTISNEIEDPGQDVQSDEEEEVGEIINGYGNHVRLCGLTIGSALLIQLRRQILEDLGKRVDRNVEGRPSEGKHRNKDISHVYTNFDLSGRGSDVAPYDVAGLLLKKYRKIM